MASTSAAFSRSFRSYAPAGNRLRVRWRRHGRGQRSDCSNVWLAAFKASAEIERAEFVLVGLDVPLLRPMATKVITARARRRIARTVALAYRIPPPPGRRYPQRGARTRPAASPPRRGRGAPHARGGSAFPSPLVSVPAIAESRGLRGLNEGWVASGTSSGRFHAPQQDLVRSGGD
jgi:hypothetical protein